MTNEQAKTVIAANVGNILRALGWTQTRLATEAGETKVLIGSVVNAESVVNAASLKRIADALGCSVDRLYEDPAGEPPRARQKKSAKCA